MPRKKNPKDIFVGRKKEIQTFEKMLDPKPEFRLLSLYSRSELGKDQLGGIGKTKLLERMQDICKTPSANALYTEKFVDCYFSETRSEMNILKQIAENFGISDHFKEFDRLHSQYFSTEDTSERQGLFSSIINIFTEEYVTLAEAKEDRAVVLFFDTYEFIQVIEDKGDENPPTVKSTALSNWIERELFPRLLEADQTRIVVSGRYQIQKTEKVLKELKALPLASLTPDETKDYWNERFHGKPSESTAEIATLYRLSAGRPIMLALCADVRERNLQTFQKILTGSAGTAFERDLIEKVTALISPEDRVIPLMAIVHRRMTAELLHALSPRKSVEQWREIIIKDLIPLSFVKEKQGDIVLLHDEMRRLIVQHFWGNHDTNFVLQKIYLENACRYYDDVFLRDANISEDEREIYTAEKLSYLFWANPQEALQLFGTEFEVALEDGRYAYCRTLLQEAENFQREFQGREDNEKLNYELPEGFSKSAFLEIDRRRVQYDIEVRTLYEETLKKIKELLDRHSNDTEWNITAICGHFWLLKGMAELNMGSPKNAVASFLHAKRVFRKVPDYIWFNRANNWLGVAYLAQNDYKEAEDWWEVSREGFFKELEKQEYEDFDRRRLLQGVRYAFGNLVHVYNHQGQFDNAVRYAEIALTLVSHLEHNAKETAKTHILVCEMLTAAGRTIEARFHADAARKIFDEKKIQDDTWSGRLYTNLCLLEYRNKEFAFLLEYYRACEIEDIIIKKRFVDEDNIRLAQEHIDRAIKFLVNAKRQQANAYYAQGELYVVSPDDDHWEKAEKAFNICLKLAEETNSEYRLVDTLESLVTLYYFWNGSQKISEEQRSNNEDAIEVCRKQIEKFDRDKYPNLFAKYEITSGDILFDSGLSLLQSEDERKTGQGIKDVKTAFEHYVKAVNLLEKYNKDQYYLALKVFSNRLNSLLALERNSEVNFKIVNCLDDLKTVWEGRLDDFTKLYTSIELRIQAHNKSEKIQQLQERVLEVQDSGNFGLALLLNDCLIEAYKSKLSLSENLDDESSDEIREELILRSNAQSRFYRALGDEYQSTRCINDAKTALAKLKNQDLRKAIEGYTNCTDGTLQYRKGEYGKLLEFYLKDELKTARDKFNEQFDTKKGVEPTRQRAKTLLEEAKGSLTDVLTSWEKSLQRITEPNEKEKVTLRIQRYTQFLSETKFRLGELFMLNEEFEESFEYFDSAIEDAERSGYGYFYDNTLQSYATAYYFSDDYSENPDREKYEKLLEKKLETPDVKMYPSIMGRLRITQGDAIFSQYFKKNQNAEGPRYIIDSERNVVCLDEMIEHYVDACNLMSQHGSSDFNVAVRVLQRRIELIADKQSLLDIQSILPEHWTSQEYLVGRRRKVVLESLVQFARIRSLMVK